MTAPQIGHEAGCSDCDLDFGSLGNGHKQKLLFSNFSKSSTKTGQKQRKRCLLFGSLGVFGFFAFGCPLSFPFSAATDWSVPSMVTGFGATEFKIRN